MKTRMTNFVRMVLPCEIVALSDKTPVQKSQALALRFKSATKQTMFLLPYNDV